MNRQNGGNVDWNLVRSADPQVNLMRLHKEGDVIGSVEMIQETSKLIHQILKVPQTLMSFLNGFKPWIESLWLKVMMRKRH